MSNTTPARIRTLMMKRTIYIAHFKDIPIEEETMSDKKDQSNMHAGQSKKKRHGKC